LGPGNPVDAACVELLGPIDYQGDIDSPMFSGGQRSDYTENEEEAILMNLGRIGI